MEDSTSRNRPDLASRDTFVLGSKSRVKGDNMISYTKGDGASRHAGVTPSTWRLLGFDRNAYSDATGSM
jgi:hypothetical protein